MLKFLQPGVKVKYVGNLRENHHYKLKRYKVYEFINYFGYNHVIIHAENRNINVPCHAFTLDI
jgi:hypothetical protein